VPEQIRELAGEPLRLSFPSQGDASQIAILTGRRQRLVVKRAQGEQACTRLMQERRVLFLLPELPFKVPHPRLLCQSNTPYDPECWLVMDLVPGEPLRTILARTPERNERTALLGAWGATLGAIHHAPVPLGLAAGMGRWLDTILAQADLNLRTYGANTGSPDALARLVLERPDPVPQTLIHGDFTLENTLVQDGVITGVVDWSWGAWGDPRYDLALALRPKREAFRARADVAAFYEGYGGPRVSAPELRYFVKLYSYF
jgi:aminoglycoside phosphotransferase (APT) family kinase protein